MAVRRRADLEQHILETIHEFYQETGIPPTYREVSNRVNTAHSNVWQAVKHLREGGFLRETDHARASSLLLSRAGLSRISKSTNTARTNSLVSLPSVSSIGGK